MAGRHIHDKRARHILVLILDEAPTLMEHVKEIVGATNAEPGTKPPPDIPQPDLPRLQHNAQALNTGFAALALRVSRAPTPQSKHGRKGQQKMVDALHKLEGAMASLVAATYRTNQNQKGYTLSHIQEARDEMSRALSDGHAALRILQR
jgi:hypothetical protein